jgi:dihydropteroate synthase
VGHNLALLRGLGALAALGRPVVVGASRKSFLGAVLARPDGAPAPVAERLEGTLAVTAWCALAGASLVRVHDAAASVRVLRVLEALLEEAV